jgi:GWxTD domain-containing protein
MITDAGRAILFPSSRGVTMKLEPPRYWFIALTTALLLLPLPSGHGGAGSCRAQPPDAAAPGSHFSRLRDDPQYEDVFSRSFEAVLSDSQLQVYGGLRAENRVTYRRRYWTANDPTPSTERNEFLEEHLGRLEYVLECFCPDGGFDWDDRGDVALRYGIPPSRVTTIGDFLLTYGAFGMDPPAEIWTYPRMEMTIRFLDANLDGRYLVGEDLKRYTARPPPRIVNDGASGVPKVDASGPTDAPPRPTNVEARHAAARARSMRDEGRRALAEVPVSYGYAPPAEPIPLYYEVVTAKGAGGATDVAVNYQLPIESVTVGEGAAVPSASLTKRVRVLSTDHDVITTDARTISLSGDVLGAAGRAGLVTDEWRLDTEPGTYIIEIAVEDTLTNRAGHGRSRVTVPDYSSPDLSMSDISIATSVGEGSRFLRRGGAVVPQPIRAFGRDEEAVIYIEVYGLEGDRAGRSYFSVTTEVTGLGYEEEKGWLSRFVSRIFPEGEHSVASRVEAWGEAPDTAYWYALSLENLAEDNYRMTVTVTDLVADQTVTREATFTVLER